MPSTTNPIEYFNDPVNPWIPEPNVLHVSKLMEGGKKWNLWRKENPDIKPVLCGAIFSNPILDYEDRAGNLKLNLSGADLRNCDFSQLGLERTNFRSSLMANSKLMSANLEGSNFYKADLSGADLRGSYLLDVNLKKADLTRCNFGPMDYEVFDDTDRNEESRKQTVISSTTLRGANFSSSKMGGTIFTFADLSHAIGLESVKHEWQSFIDVSTLTKSRGNISISFLKNCGFSDTFITYLSSLTTPPIEFFSCFISHAHKDKVFAARLNKDMIENGVDSWYFPENMKIGSRIRPTIDMAIKLQDKLLLVLSKNSINSQWVLDEVEAALELERIYNRLIVFPIMIDDSVMTTDVAWAAKIRRTRHIGDFKDWKIENSYYESLSRLLRDFLEERGDQKFGKDSKWDFSVSNN